ncbi:MAG: chloramphenicol acetyltransferase [Acidobacteria bacterium]|nr:chloramphenicol acetyltransferase [Acidobacteriota bacterium]
MRKIDIGSWKRRTTFEYFKDFEDPFFNLTAPVDAGSLYRFAKANDLSFALMSLHCSLQAANSIPELRLRIIGDEVVEFDRIHATQTILNADDTFSFCYFEYHPNPIDFVRAGKVSLDKYRGLKTFDVEDERLDLIYYSVIPWVSFTSFKHASRHDNRQSVPRMVFGKLYRDGERHMMPHSVEVHHALADGLHVGRYFEALQTTMDAVGNL